MIGQGIRIPQTVLNKLNEAEYARRLQHRNLFFREQCSRVADMIKPYNKKFLTNYVLSCSQLLEQIGKIIEDDIKGGSDPKTVNNTSQYIQEDQTKSADELVKRVLSTIELQLAPPNMSTTKAQYEELQAQADAIQKMLDLLYPDDAAPSDDLRSFMSALVQCWFQTH